MTAEPPGSNDGPGDDPAARPDRRRQLALWVIAAAVGVGVGFGLDAVGVPSPTLFAGLVAGGVVALGSPDPPKLPVTVSRAAQAIIGTSIGTTVTLSALREVGSHWLTTLLVTSATVGASIIAGLWLARIRKIPRITGVLALISGGASAITATARELGADDRVVAVIQYLRVLIILATMPIIALALFHAESTPSAETGGRLWSDLVFTALSVGVGWLIALLLPGTTMYLLAPMVIATAIALSGILGPVDVPPLIEALCFIALGLQVGLRFTRASLRAIGRMLPAAAALILVVIVVSAGLGLILVWVAGVDGLTAYLATTPGGLPAVLALASGSSADATFIFALQLARLLMVLAVAPLLTRWLAPGRDPG